MWHKIIAFYNPRIYTPAVRTRLSEIKNIKNYQACKTLMDMSTDLAVIIENTIVSGKAT